MQRSETVSGTGFPTNSQLPLDKRRYRQLVSFGTNWTYVFQALTACLVVGALK